VCVGVDRCAVQVARVFVAVPVSVSYTPNQNNRWRKPWHRSLRELKQKDFYPEIMPKSCIEAK
jgi:hypothetical protein